MAVTQSVKLCLDLLDLKDQQREQFDHDPRSEPRSFERIYADSFSLERRNYRISYSELKEASFGPESIW